MSVLRLILFGALLWHLDAAHTPASGHASAPHRTTASQQGARDAPTVRDLLGGRQRFYPYTDALRLALVSKHQTLLSQLHSGVFTLQRANEQGPFWATAFALTPFSEDRALFLTAGHTLYPKHATQPVNDSHFHAAIGDTFDRVTRTRTVQGYPVRRVINIPELDLGVGEIHMPWIDRYLYGAPHPLTLSTKPASEWPTPFVYSISAHGVYSSRIERMGDPSRETDYFDVIRRYWPDETQNQYVPAVPSVTVGKQVDVTKPQLLRNGGVSLLWRLLSRTHEKRVPLVEVEGAAEHGGSGSPHFLDLADSADPNEVVAITIQVVGEPHGEWYNSKRCIQACDARDALLEYLTATKADLDRHDATRLATTLSQSAGASQATKTPAHPQQR